MVNIYPILLQTDVFKKLIRVLTESKRATLVLIKGAMRTSIGHREERWRDGNREGIKEVLDQHLTFSYIGDNVENEEGCAIGVESGETNLSEVAGRGPGSRSEA